MNDKIRNYVEDLFADAPRTRQAAELRDELTANLRDRYEDLLARGQDEETAYRVVIEGIGDIDGLLRGLREEEAEDPELAQMQRQKSALIVSSAIAVYILSVIFPLVGNLFGGIGDTVGIILMLVCCAAATMMLVYNGMTQPKKEKTSGTIVDDFKAWSTKKEDSKAVIKLVSSVIWSVATMLFLILGVFFDAWNPGWLVFPLAAVVSNIVAMGLKMGDDSK